MTEKENMGVISDYVKDYKKIQLREGDKRKKNITYPISQILIKSHEF